MKSVLNFIYVFDLLRSLLLSNVSRRFKCFFSVCSNDSWRLAYSDGCWHWWLGKRRWTDSPFTLPVAPPICSVNAPLGISSAFYQCNLGVTTLQYTCNDVWNAFQRIYFLRRFSWWWHAAKISRISKKEIWQPYLRLRYFDNVTHIKMKRTDRESGFYEF